MSDPIREALVAKVNELRAADVTHDVGGSQYNTDEACAHHRGRTDGAEALLAAYDAAKLMHGDTAEAQTIKIKRLTGRKKK